MRIGRALSRIALVTLYARRKKVPATDRGSGIREGTTSDSRPRHATRATRHRAPGLPCGGTPGTAMHP